MAIQSAAIKPSCSFTYGGAQFVCGENNFVRKDGGAAGAGSSEFVYETGDGLRVTRQVTEYPAYGAVRWVQWFENTGSADTKLITDLWDCDVTLPFYEDYRPAVRGYESRGSVPPKVWRTMGSNWAKDEYCAYSEDLNPRGERRYANRGGRSAQGLAPYFDVSEGQKGVIAAVGWTGQWNAVFTSGDGDIRIRTGIEGVSLVLRPGEKIRTSSAVLLVYENGRDEGHIMFRRLVKDCFSPIGKGERPSNGPLCTGGWGGITSSLMLERIALLKKYNIGAESYWIDAGWYGYSKGECPNEFTGDWGAHTGSWNVNPNYHPDGLLEVSKAIKDAGMSFILWFEPERVIRGTDTPKNHPEWFLDGGDPNQNNLLLNLGSEEALMGTYEMLSEKIETLGVDCYRQDFNTDPLGYWRAADTENRRGITEIKHIMGLYRLWDMLLERFPRLYIDNCASGGRRNDIEMMSRSIPLWRSDYQCWWDFDPETSQNHMTGISWWLPYSGTGTGVIMGDLYRMRSCYAPTMTTAFWQYSDQQSPNDSQPLDAVREQFEEYKKVRPYTSCDFYPLTSVDLSDAVWCAWQFNRPEENDGIILAFRRPGSPYEKAVFTLGGLDADADYIFEDADTKETVAAKGKTLMGSEGFEIIIGEKRSSKLFFYHKA